MWCDNVDEWLSDNAVHGGHRSKDALDSFNDYLGYFILAGMTLGVSLLIAILSKRFFPKKWYCEHIYSRFNENKNIKFVKHEIKRIYREAGTVIDVTGGEEVLFFIEDQQSKKHGIIITNKRLISNLMGQSRIKDLPTLKNVNWYAEPKGWTFENPNPHFALFFDNNELGILSNAKSELYLDFMDVVSDSITRNF
jgi:hypothetical protein